MEFNTTNNVTIQIKAAPFKDACELKRAVAKALKGTSLFEGLTSNNYSLMDIKLDSLLQVLFDLDTSNEFENAAMNCLRCCIYDKGGKNLKITTQLFDDIPEAREDYYEILTKCVEENLRPFFKSLASEFSNRLAAIPEENPASK